MTTRSASVAWLADDDFADRSAPPLGATIALTIGFWLFNLLVSFVSYVLDGVEDWQQRGSARLVTFLVGLLICAGIHLILGRCGRWAFWKRAALIFVLALLGGEALSWANALALEALGGAPTASPKPGAILLNVVYWGWFLLAWASLYLALSYSYEAREKERRWASVQVLAQAAQMRALQYQIRPHFLFNALNAVAALVLDRQGGEAVTMLRRLADFVRRSLELDPVGDVSLADEVELQALYLRIEEARFPDLSVQVEIEPALREIRVPPLILQPIVENAVKFSVSRSLNVPRILIRARSVGRRVELLVEDSGGGATNAPEGFGIGLQNVRERLHRRFGAEADMEAGPTPEGGFAVRLLIPTGATP